MKNVTITLEEDLVRRARIQAAREGKSLSRFVSELVTKHVGREMNQQEAMRAFLAGPAMDLTDENGKAPSRDELYD
ncbi:MAG TPA: DUF6364 family protein [Beijerinckiaceae bacterium]|nr:DUF6364 family protein [Beijerinckiaceae bacterium]